MSKRISLKLTDKDIEDAQKDGWQCIQINVC